MNREVFKRILAIVLALLMLPTFCVAAPAETAEHANETSQRQQDHSRASQADQSGIITIDEPLKEPVITLDETALRNIGYDQPLKINVAESENVIRFADVDENSWAAEYIYYLAELGIVGGVGDNMFAPKRSITRAEFVKMLALTADADLSMYTISHFKDVSATAWFAPYVEWAYLNSITNGLGDGKFAPAEKITRQDMATMIYRYILKTGIPLPQNAQAILFTDEGSFQDYAKAAITALQQAEILGGFANPDGTFRFAPEALTTREQASKMLALLRKQRDGRLCQNPLLPG